MERPFYLPSHLFICEVTCLFAKSLGLPSDTKLPNALKQRSTSPNRSDLTPRASHQRHARAGTVSRLATLWNSRERK